VGIDASDMSWFESYRTSYNGLNRLGLLVVCPDSIDRIALYESLNITICLLSVNCLAVVTKSLIAASSPAYIDTISDIRCESFISVLD